MSIPDFGKLHSEFQGVPMSCKAIAPGLSLQDLIKAFESAKAEAAPGDELSGNPSKWPEVRGIKAVANAILNAIYPAGTPT